MGTINGEAYVETSSGSEGSCLMNSLKN